MMLKDKISSQVEFMERNPDCSICYHDALAFDSDTKQTLYYFSKRNKLSPRRYQDNDWIWIV